MGGGRGFLGERSAQKGPHKRRVFRARGLNTIRRRLADFGRFAKALKKWEICEILTGTAWLGCPLSVARMPPQRGSDAPSAPLGCPLFPPTSWRPARGQMLLLARARNSPDVDQIVPDLKPLDRADGFEIPQRLAQILLEVSKLFCSAPAELVQVGYAQRVGRGVGGVEAVQPQRQGLATQPLALLPVDLRPLGAAEERRELGVNLQDGPAGGIVTVKVHQIAAVCAASIGDLDRCSRQPRQGRPEPFSAALTWLPAKSFEKTFLREPAPRAEGRRPGQVQGLFPHVQVGLVELPPRCNG